MRTIKSYASFKLSRYLPMWSNKSGKSPFLVIILPTNCCNLRCKYCPETKEQKKVHIPKTTVFRMLDELDKIGLPMLSFSGGEPLLHPNFDEIAEYASRKGFIMNLNTNGTLLKNHLNTVRRFDFVRISLDGDRKKHDSICGVPGSYDRVIEGLQELYRYKRRPKIGINVVVSNKNIKKIKKMLKDVERVSDFISILPEFNSYQNSKTKTTNKLRHESYNTAFNSIKSKGNTKHFASMHDLEQIRSSCQAGILFYSISWDGNVYSCPFMLENRPTISYKNRKFSFKSIPYDNPIKHCQGCHATCAVEISRVYTMSPFELLKHFFELKRVFRL